MMENHYDDPLFYEKYSQMERSRQGLDGAGEWDTLRQLLPDFSGKRVLDLGCGFGWHCRWAADHGAVSVLGTDCSERMLETARRMTEHPAIRYQRLPIEDTSFPKDSFDVVLSSLAFHYISSFDPILERVRSCLISGGDFVFSVEHPVFTSYGSQDWYRDKEGKILHFPVDRYFQEGERKAVFLDEPVTKYHRTLTTYLDGLLTGGFSLRRVVEPRPPARMMGQPGMRDELRRPMMLLVAAVKQAE